MVIVILETSVPDKTPYKQGYNFTVKHTSYNWQDLSKDTVAYGYLSESAAVSIWRSFKQYFKKIGFIDVVALPQTLVLLPFTLFLKIILKISAYEKLIVLLFFAL
jgi:demethylmenaquinone methyltransferase/2-methoxy-6-polyprenyl-1,4-benzoquinol methylase